MDNNKFINKVLDLIARNKTTKNKMLIDLNLSRGSFSAWERRGTIPSGETLTKIADYFGVSVDYLLGNTDIKEKPSQDDWESKLKVYPVESWYIAPVVGTVRAGYNGVALEEIIGYEPIYDVKNPEECFWLRVEGDSMSPLIMENDLVLVRKQQDVDSGSIAVVIYNGDEGAVKRVIKHTKAITLASINPEYEPRILVGEELQDFRIVGEVIETKRKFKG